MGFNTLPLYYILIIWYIVINEEAYLMLLVQSISEIKSTLIKILVDFIDICRNGFATLFYNVYVAIIIIRGLFKKYQILFFVLKTKQKNKWSTCSDFFFARATILNICLTKYIQKNQTSFGNDAMSIA